MKKLIFLFLLTYLGLCSQVQAQQDCNPTSVFDCTPVQIKTIFINPSGFPDCDLKVQYRYRVCTGGVLEFLDWKFMNLGSTDCGQFFSYVKNKLNTVEEFQNFWTNLDEQIYLAASAEYATALINSGNPNLFDCSSSYSSVSTKYFRASCVSIWIGETGQQNDDFVAQQVPCYSTGCCNLSSISYYDKKKGKIVTKIVKEPNGNGLCGGELPPRPPYTPPFNWVAQSPCIAFCTENDPIEAKVKYTNSISIDDGFKSWYTNDEISILTPTTNDGETITLLSTDGKIITTIKVEQSTSKISTVGLSKGIYLLSWKRVRGNTITQKISIN